MEQEDNQRDLTRTINMGSLRPVSDQLSLLLDKTSQEERDVINALGDEIGAGKVCGEVESTKSVSEIYAPLSGRVVLVNDALDSAPETLNKEPYGQGWIFEVEISTASELEGLLSAGDYASLTA